MSEQPITAADWRGQWDDLGRQTDRMDYLRRHFPSLVNRIDEYLPLARRMWMLDACQRAGVHLVRFNDWDEDDHGEWFRRGDEESALVEALAALPPSAPPAPAREDEPEPTHPWDGMPDGHNCASCGPESIWKCDRPAHPPRPAGRVMPTRAEYADTAERIVDGLVAPPSAPPALDALIDRIRRLAAIPDEGGILVRRGSVESAIREYARLQEQDR